MQKLLSSPIGKQITYICLYGVGITSISMMIWTFGPMLSVGGYRPFDNYIVRETVIALLMAAVAGAGGISFWRKRKSAAALADGIAESSGEKKTSTPASSRTR